MREQSFVHVAEEAHANRKTASKFLQPELQCGNATAHFARILDWNARLFIDLVQQEVSQR
jgi:hypothetical protein